MAIYHFSAKLISRANGSSALAAAAYRSASRLHDQRLDRHHDFSNKAGVVHSEVMLPEGAPEPWRDREQLWNAVEAAEKRVDAQLAREIEFAIPREMSVAQGVALARDFVQREFVDRGMVADLNVHWDVGADGTPKPHAHVMLTTREVGPDGFGAKVRDWNRTELLTQWREVWAAHVNERLAELDIDARVDHRSLEAQGIDLQPQNKIGPAASRMAERGHDSERLIEHHAIAHANGEKIIANPRIALDAITHRQATFTVRDLAMFVHRHSDGKDQFDRTMAMVRGSYELIPLGRDGHGNDRFTSRAMLEVEQRLERATEALAGRNDHGLSAAAIDRAIAAAESNGLRLAPEQQTALEHLVAPGDLATIIGYAGTGKTAMLGVARDGWESAGHRVQGLALSGIAAENLKHGSGIASRTIASLEHQWSQGRDLLTVNDVLVIDEAGMIGTRQMERILSEAVKRGAKVVLVGDPEQLQAIEAGAAFRSIAERHGAVEITEVRRQSADWQRLATRQLATGRTDEALAAYADHGHVHPVASRSAAREALIARWDAAHEADPRGAQLILAHTREEVTELNLLARERRRLAGGLGDGVNVVTERGPRQFAAGDRVMFLRNERGLGVKNGSLGSVQSVSAARMAVLLDDGRRVAFDLKEYPHLDHGYAATIHKAQGMTVDRVHVLATPGLDRHAAYVALSRHREGVELHYGTDDFADHGKLVRTLSRERAKDMASDYVRDFADRREIRVPASVVEKAQPTPRTRDPFASFRPVPQPSRDVFVGLRLQARAPALETQGQSALRIAVERFARAVSEQFKAHDAGREMLPHQRQAYDAATQTLDAAQPGAASHLHRAFVRDRSLIDEAARGRTALAIQAMILEAEIGRDPVQRADRFVEDWQKLAREHRRLSSLGDHNQASRIASAMAGMAKQLERDPQLESLLRPRARQLGIDVMPDRSLSQSIQDWVGLSRGRGLGR